jgi:hypothetical protein
MQGSPSQGFVPIKNIKDGLIELQSGEYRAVLMTNSLNLSLKGEDEQTAILTQFQNFLNSLEFPIQIFVKSRRMDISPYIKLLEERLSVAEGELIKLQIAEYINYIKIFSEETNIMSKQFFVVVPYTPAVINTSGVPTLSFGGSDAAQAAKSDAAFQEIYRQMEQRLLVVSSGLTRSGLRVDRLQSDEVVELFYNIFNPSSEYKAIIN